MPDEPTDEQPSEQPPAGALLPPGPWPQPGPQPLPGQPYPQQPAPPNPYGGYPGGGQYGYPVGYSRPATGTNGMAIASLVLGICGFVCGITALVGLILGIVSLQKTKVTGQSGRGLAIAGIATSAAWIAVIVLLAVTGHVHFGVNDNN